MVAFNYIFFTFAAMLDFSKYDDILSFERFNTGGIVILISLISISIMAPLFTLITFQLNIEEHITDCSVRRNHVTSCRAQCILSEMMPEKESPMTNDALSSFYFFPPLFLQQSSLFHTVSLTDKIVANQYAYYLERYVSPTIEITLPPPRC